MIYFELYINRKCGSICLKKKFPYMYYIFFVLKEHVDLQIHTEPFSLLLIFFSVYILDTFGKGNVMMQLKSFQSMHLIYQETLGEESHGKPISPATS